KLYVAGLTAHATEEPLRSLFGRYGEVTEVRIITDRDSGLCKGFAFLGFANKEMAQAAKFGLDGYKLDGKNLVVRTAGAKDERPPRGGPMGGGGPPPHDRQGSIRGPMGAFPPLPPGAGGPPPPYGHGPPPGYGGPPPPYGHGPPPGYGGPPPPYGHAPPPPGHWGFDPYGGWQRAPLPGGVCLSSWGGGKGWSRF
ncbi:MAG: hypothetical protein J3K34DRAFT_370317, partial [Monoraphidium minutum]